MELKKALRIYSCKKGEFNMTEKKFLSFILTEGILLTLLGLGMLMLPKLTSLTFGIMVCIGFFVYGIYKTINAFFARNYTRHFILNMVLGILLAVIGVLLFFAPSFNLILITSAIGIYFLLESISTTAFAIQTRKTLYLWWANLFVSLLQFLIGFIIIMGLPGTAFWVVGILTGINFLIAGMIMISLFISNKYVYNI